MAELRKNEIYESVIDGFTSEGAGVCRIGGRAVFVSRALPGERWRIRIVKANRTVVWGRGEELLVPSPHRIDPVCPSFGRCGGCACQHMDYESELTFKLDRLNSALRRIGGLSLQADTIYGADSLESYRNKAIYNFAPGPVCGFYRGRTHDVIETTRCLLQPESFDRIAFALKAWMLETDTPAYDEVTGTGSIRHLYLRRGTNGILACIVSAADIDPSAADSLCAACPELRGVLLCINADRGNVVLSDNLRTLWGEDRIEQNLCGARFLLSAQTFFQVNTGQAEKLYRLVGDYAEPAGKTVLDLYCGAGSIGLSAARNAACLIGNDIVQSAVENAIENAVINGASNTEYFCGDASAVAKKMALNGLRPDIIITDPPRKGMNNTAISAICDMVPERIVYVSCDPGTLARDLKNLCTHGYDAVRCDAVDMFPRTNHVETICLLSKLSEAKNHISVKVDMDEMNLTAAESKATYDEIRDWVQENYGFHVTNLNIAKTKQKCGIIERINYNLPKSENSKSPGTPKEKEDAIMDAFKHFQMI